MTPRGSYSIAGLARALAVSRGRVRSWLRAGELRTCDLRKAGADRATVRILGSEVERFLAARSAQAPATGDGGRTVRGRSRRRRGGGIRRYSAAMAAGIGGDV